jgi:hypothetical protein
MNTNRYIIAKFGYWVSIITAAITVMTFAIAINTPPLSGPYCQTDCFEYPYHEVISRFPRDYYWMFPAIILSFSYLVMMIVFHKSVPQEKNVFSLIGTGFAIISTIILSLDYFVQVSFIQPSLIAGETEGIAMLSQFNPHGLFIILEELGFITMNISFFCLVPVFSSSIRGEKVLKLTFITGFVLMVLSFAAISLIHGLNREYRFEVVIITITWIELIIAGILFARYFKMQPFFQPR